MVRAAQKGEAKATSPEVARTAASIKMKDAKKFASTKHKGLPEKKMKKESVSEDAKMARQSDDKLSAAHKKFSGMEQTPANSFMKKRIEREINRRKKGIGAKNEEKSYYIDKEAEKRGRERDARKAQNKAAAKERAAQKRRTERNNLRRQGKYGAVGGHYVTKHMEREGVETHPMSLGIITEKKKGMVKIKVSRPIKVKVTDIGAGGKEYVRKNWEQTTVTNDGSKLSPLHVPGGPNSQFNVDGTKKVLKKTLNKVRGTAFKTEDIKMSRKAYKKLHKDFKSDDPKNPRTTKYEPGKGTVSHRVKFTDEYVPEGSNPYGKRAKIKMIIKGFSEKNRSKAGSVKEDAISELASPLPHPDKDTRQKPNPNQKPSSPYEPGKSPYKLASAKLSKEHAIDENIVKNVGAAMKKVGRKFKDFVNKPIMAPTINKQQHLKQIRDKGGDPSHWESVQTEGLLTRKKKPAKKTTGRDAGAIAAKIMRDKEHKKYVNFLQHDEEKKFGPGGDPIKRPGFVDKALKKLKNTIPVKKIDTDIKTESKELKKAKINYKTTKKGGKTTHHVNKNDESDAQKAMKNDPKYILGKTRVKPVKEESCGKGMYYCKDMKKCKPIPEGYKVESDGNLVKEGAAWTKKAGKNKSGGLNEKGRKSYEKANPGSDLKAPSKKVGNPRRASFCARMSGMKKKLTSKKTANDPDSRINKSLRAWNCEYEPETPMLPEATRLKKEKGYDKGGTKKPTGPKVKDAALDAVKAKYKGQIMRKGSNQPKKVKGQKTTGVGKYLARHKENQQLKKDAKEMGYGKDTKSYVNTRARYGSKENMKSGKGLGT